MAETLRKRWAEDSMIGVTLVPTVSTSGKTVYAYAVNRAGTATQIGTGTGAAASTAISMTFDLRGLGTGFFDIEIIADPTSANPTTLMPCLSYNRFAMEIYDLRSNTTA
jgi:hypothetical protein